MNAQLGRALRTKTLQTLVASIALGSCTPDAEPDVAIEELSTGGETITIFTDLTALFF